MECFRRELLALAVAAVCAIPVVAQAQSATEPDVAAQWRELMAHGTIEAATAASGVIDAVDYTVDAVNADKCKAHAGELAEALRQIPVSIVLQRTAMLCAEATGDKVAADRASLALAALARDAFAQASRGAWPTPVRIVYPGDAYALFASAGMTIRYEAFINLRAAPYYPWRLAVAPRDGGPERQITFDFIHTLQALDRKNEAYGTPRLAMMYVNGFLAEDVKDGRLRGIDANAVKTAVDDEPTAQGEVRVLRPAAEQGGLLSMQRWLMVCAQNPYPGCADGLIDALLPQAEARHAFPMLLLALAYAEGIGVPQDLKAAEAMLDAANRQLAQHDAASQYSDLYGSFHPDQAFPPYLRQRLQAERDAGSAVAAIVLIVSDIRLQGKKYILTPENEAHLADPANNGTGRGLMALASWYEDRDKDKFEAYLKQAAAADNPEALRIFAYRLRKAQGSEPPSAEALAWFERAANGGDTGAMLYRGLLAWMDGQPRRAEDWVLPATAMGNIDALFFLGDLWTGGYENMSGTPENAVAFYENLAKSDEYGARARRELAALAIAGTGMPKDPARARTWLTQDAEAGDLRSQMALAGILLDGDLSPGQEDAGRKWMERAVASDSVSAMAEYGIWLYNEGTRPGDRTRGVTLSRKAADRDNTTAINNAAWILCVSEDAQIRDPVAGLAYSNKLAAIPEIGPASLDTVAACEAAAGNYPRAVELQQRVVDSVRRMPGADSQESLEEMLARLALYKAGKPYIEARDTAGP